MFKYLEKSQLSNFSGKYPNFSLRSCLFSVLIHCDSSCSWMWLFFSSSGCVHFPSGPRYTPEPWRKILSFKFKSKPLSKSPKTFSLGYTSFPPKLPSLRIWYSLSSAVSACSIPASSRAYAGFDLRNAEGRSSWSIHLPARAEGRGKPGRHEQTTINV